VIVQADIRSPKREEPLFVLLGWKTGRFMFLPDARPERLPITASVANLLFQDLRTMEAHERTSQTEPPSKAESILAASENAVAKTLARLDLVGQRLNKLHPSAQRPLVVRLLLAGVARAGVSNMLEYLVKDLSTARWAAVGTEEPWAAYRTEIGRVRISPDVVLHLIAVRAEKRFWPMWEQCLPLGHGVLLLLAPPTKDALAHCQAFLNAREVLAPELPVQGLVPDESHAIVSAMTGLDASQVSAGSPEDQTLRLTAVDRLLQRWLDAH
jgi:hypothetical protein